MAENEQSRANVKEVKEYFQGDGNRPVRMDELKALKEDPRDYDDISNGIGDGSLKYPDVDDQRKKAAAARVDERRGVED